MILLGFHGEMLRPMRRGVLSGDSCVFPQGLDRELEAAFLKLAGPAFVESEQVVEFLRRC